MPRNVNHDQFAQLMRRVARAWATQDTSTAVSCFTPDAVYLQPPDIQLFAGHEQLSAYFGALPSGMQLDLHHTWFDAVDQHGCVEFTFRREGATTADHGTKAIAWLAIVSDDPATSDFQGGLQASKGDSDQHCSSRSYGISAPGWGGKAYGPRTGILSQCRTRGTKARISLSR